MKILLLAMPDTTSCLDYFARIPNLALVSLAGNLPGHDVRVLDLATCKNAIKKKITEILDGLQPRLVGLSAMTFQLDTLLHIARFIRRCYPETLIAAGGYGLTLMPEEQASEKSLPLDFVVRGEGEKTFRLLVEELEKPSPDLEKITGLSYQRGNEWVHNTPGEPADLGSLSLPKRDARLSKRFSLFGFPIDVAETSRGCRHNCTFCSITRMYGRSFRTFPTDRIIQDLKAIRALGTKHVFFIDDNITFNPEHVKDVCEAILRNNLHDMVFMTQASAVSIVRNPQMLEMMSRAHFRIIIVGFESMDSKALLSIQKPSDPGVNREAVRLLRNCKMAVIAACMYGYPDDNRDSVARQFRLFKDLQPDLFYNQFLTPYPGTRIREELMGQGLIVNGDHFKLYDGFTCNIKTRHLSCEELFTIVRWQGLKVHLSHPLLMLKSRFLRKAPYTYVKGMLLACRDQVYNLLLRKQIRMITGADLRCRKTYTAGELFATLPALIKGMRQ